MSVGFGSDLLEDTRVTPSDTGDHDTFSHYVRKSDLDAALLDGQAIEALCGKKWLPTKDFAKYPVCGTCKEIWESMPAG